MKFHRWLRFVLQSCVSLSAMAALFFTLIDIHGGAHAQVVTSITSSGLNTVVTPNSTTYNITGGTRPGGGPNLFHSFGDFNVATNNIANFLNNTGLPTSNILSRVTGGNTSNIFGAIQTTGFGNANLFLMNPAGFLFGPGATVNVGGMVTFTSADYLRLTDGGRFNASTHPTIPDLLTTAPVAAFGFLGSSPGSLTVQGSQISVTEGTGISLVGGDITIRSGVLDPGQPTQPARLSAPGGQINLASVRGAGEISATSFMPTQSMTLGNLNISQGTLLDVSANSAGTIRIRGGHLVIEEGTLSADTVNADGAPTAIDINLAGDLSIANDLSPAITARTTGSGNAGTVNIESANLTATSNTQDFLSLIDTHTSGEGRAGNVNITTGNIGMIGSLLGFSGFVDTGTTGPGHGGDVNITAADILVDGSVITTGNFWANAFGGDATGSGGNVVIRADSLHFLFGGIDTNSFSFAGQTGRAGDITVHAGDIHLESSNIQAQGLERGGAITVEANNVLLADSRFETQTVHTDGGGIAISAATVDLTQGSQLISTTGGDGDAGSIHVNASEHFGILEGSPFVRPSGIFTQSFGSSGTLGNAGDVIITTPQLHLADGGRINTVTKSSGRGGNVTINADSISMAGEFPDEISEPLFNLGPIHQSGIFTSTVGESCAGTCGTAGAISITTGSLGLGNGAQIDSSSASTGHGGSITIHATDTIALSGTLSDGFTPVGIFSRAAGTDPGSGNGGNILLAGQSITISEGAQVSASTTGPGNAGNITIEGQSLTLSNGATVTAQTMGAGDAGKITIDTDSMTVDGSVVSADTFGDGNAGGIEIHAGSVALTGFSLLGSGAFAGSGNAGAVQITATDRVSLSDSTIQSGSFSESPTAGNSGQIFINSPIVELQSSSTLATSAIGHGGAGAITLQTNSLTMNTSEVTSSVAGQGQGGTVTVLGLQGPESKAQTITLAADSQILTETTNADPVIPGEGAAGSISLSAAQLSLANSKISAETRFSRGHAGNINIDAGNQVIVGSNSEISSRSTAGADPAFQYGNAGSIFVSTPTLALSDGSTITASTETNGAGGAITLHVASLSLDSGGHLTSGSVIGPEGLIPTGSAGDITIQDLSGAAQSVLINGAGSGLFTATQGSGAGGDIAVSAQSVTLQDGAQISSSSTGTGAAGNINITAENQFTMVNSSVTTEANQSSGGIIKITTNPSGTVELSNSTISASVLDGTGGGGSVNIDPQFVILQNSQILARAVEGPGGNINITITNGGLFLPDATSVVSASSQFGQSGTVTIQAPIAPAGGKIQPLGAAPLQVTTLLSQRCAAIARGEVSSFVLAGRDTLPTEPGGWLTSPLASMTPDAGSALQASIPLITSALVDSVRIDLRRLPSPWKMAHLGGNDWFTGCNS